VKRVLIAGANIYNANKGVAALATSSVYLLHKVLSATDHEICVYNLEFRRERDSILLPDGTLLKIKNIYPTDIFSIPGFFKTLFTKSRLYYLKEFLKCDYVFNLCAGDGFSDIYGEDILRSLSRVNKLCRLFHKPYYMLPQTYGPFFSKTSFEFAKKECLSARLLMSRDKESTKFLKTEFGLTNVLDTIDVAFFLPYRQLKKNTDAIHIGVNLSETLCSKHRGHRFEIAQNYLSVMKGVISQLLSEGYKIHLIPHVSNTDNSPKNEYSIQYKLWEELQHPGLVPPPFFLSASDAKSYISSLDLFVGSRMHACIAAFSANVPVLPLGYSKKFSGLFRDTLNYPYLIDITNDISAETITGEIRKMVSRIPEIKAMIGERNQTVVREKTDHLYRVLSEILL